MAAHVAHLHMYNLIMCYIDFILATSKHNISSHMYYTIKKNYTKRTLIKHEEEFGMYMVG